MIKIDTLLLNADGQPLSQVPLSVVTWHDALRLQFLDKVNVLKVYEDWVVRSQKLEIHVPSIIMMKDHVKWTRHLKYSRTNIFLRDDFTCQLQYTYRCKQAEGKAKLSELTIDHVVPRADGGQTTWSNVCTACKDCNSEKGSNRAIVPKKKPYKPSYYEILAKRKTLPISIRDAEWAYYLDWDPNLIRVVPRS